MTQKLVINRKLSCCPIHSYHLNNIGLRMEEHRYNKTSSQGKYEGRRKLPALDETSQWQR